MQRPSIVIHARSASSHTAHLTFRIAIVVLNSALLLAVFLAVSRPSLFQSVRFKLSPHRDANIAFFVQIVPSTLPHLPRLFTRIYHPSNVYGLHFDANFSRTEVADAVTELREQVPTFDSNTYVIPADRIVYNGISMVLNTLAAMTFLLEVPNPWDFFINLSGSDYPMTEPYLPRELLGRILPYGPVFFSLANSTRWMSTFNFRANDIVFDSSLTHRDAPGAILPTQVSSPIASDLAFRPVHAEAWMIVTRAFCQYATHAPVARRLLLTFANMRGADEFFFATLAYNNPVFNRSLVPQVKRLIVWHDAASGRHAGQHPYYLDAFEQGKWVFKDRIYQGTQWHARKFQNNDSGLLDLIDAFADDPPRVERGRRDFANVIAALERRIAESSVTQ